MKTLVDQRSRRLKYLQALSILTVSFLARTGICGIEVAAVGLHSG
jgi:hypothetical protein